MVSRLHHVPALVLLALARCGVEAETQAGEAASATVREPPLPGVEIVQIIQLGGGRDQEHVIPLASEISAGWVEFITLDRRVHTLSFIVDSLAAEAYDYLRTTDQVHSPPLLERGTRFLVDLSGAPEGRYVFSSRSHGEPVYGSITVRRGTVPS